VSRGITVKELQGARRQKVLLKGGGGVIILYLFD